MQNKVIHKISELTESVLSNTDFFFVDVEIKGSNVPEVWVLVDAEDRGVNMDECAEISNELSFLMDAHDMFSKEYRINVSSPGLSRPLTDRRQYAKNKGREVKAIYMMRDGRQKVEGVLQSVNDESITVKTEESTRQISFENLVETTIIPTIT